MRRGLLSVWVSLLALSLVPACGGGDDGPLGDLVLSASTGELRPGDTLVVDVGPDGPSASLLHWSSSDTRLAGLVAPGHVLARSPGVVTITARDPETDRQGSIEIRVVPEAEFNESLPTDPRPFAPTLEREVSIPSSEVTLRLTGIAATTISVQSRRFHRLLLPHAGTVTEEGRPELPFFTLRFAIPVVGKTGVRARWRVDVERGSPVVHTGIRPWPHQPPHWIDGESEEADRPPAFVQDEAAYASQEPWPAITHTTESVEAGNLPVLEVRVVPVEYVPATGTLEVFRRVDVRVAFQGDGELVMPRPVGDYKDTKERGADELVLDTLQNSALVSPLRHADLSGPLAAPDLYYHQDTPFDLLIVTRPALYASAQVLAELRQGLGTRVWLESLDESTYPDASAILERVMALDESNRLATADEPKAHAMRAVLIFGDVEHVPTFDGIRVRNFDIPTAAKPASVRVTGTDLPYSLLRGLDWWPDVALGRISVDEDTEGLDVVAKIEAYETQPRGAAPEWVAFHADFEDEPEFRTIVSGQATFTEGVTTVTGTDTEFEGQVFRGDLVRPFEGVDVDEGRWQARVQRVVSPTLLILEEEWPGPSTPGDGLQVALQDGRDNREFLKPVERARHFLRDLGVRTRFGYSRNAEPRTAPAPVTGYDGWPLAWDLLTYAWDCDRADIRDPWNEGRDAFVVHSDHGKPWGWKHPPFHHKDLPVYDNGAGPWYPIVFSVNCSSGHFDTETDKIWIWHVPRKGGGLAEVRLVDCTDDYWPPDTECFCESVLLRPHGGGVAAVGASRGTDASTNEALIDGLFGAMYATYEGDVVLPGPSGRRPYELLGDVVRAAKYSMLDWALSQTGDVASERAYFHLQAYHLFGDPMLRIRRPRVVDTSD